MNDTSEEYLSVREASALLGVKRETLYAYVSRGVIKSYRQGIGRQRLYLRSELEALLTIRQDEGQTQAIPPEDRSTPQAKEDTPQRHHDTTFRDVNLPDAETWAGDH